MENKVNQRVIEFINYKKISKLQFGCFSEKVKCYKNR